MRFAAVVPTRNRAHTADRAVRTFLSALRRTGLASAVTIAVADDSDDAAESALLVGLMREMAATHNARIDLVGHALGARGIFGGPGAARNRALGRLRETAPDAEVTVMFDDDVVFDDTHYRGVTLRCDGARLLREASGGCGDRPTVAGCAYIGRQDLSILEHVRLAPSAGSDDRHVMPALDRAGVESVAPGGISTAFLMVGAPPAALPDFPEHYNEDYVWLHALAGAGWPLLRVPTPLIHAPPGDVLVTLEGLSFQVHGEIVWLAVLERERFPVDDPAAMAAAVREIAGDLRSALMDPVVVAQPAIAELVGTVLAGYDAIALDLAAARATAETSVLLDQIRAGLDLMVAREWVRPL